MVPQEPTHKLCHGNEEHRRLYESGVHVSYLKRNTIVPIARNQKGLRRFAALLLTVRHSGFGSPTRRAERSYSVQTADAYVINQFIGLFGVSCYAASLKGLRT